MRDLAAGIALGIVAVLAVAQAAAEPVPSGHRGMFGTSGPDGGCAATSPVVLVNGTMAVAVTPSPEGSSVIMGEADWAGGVLLLHRGDGSIVLPSLDNLDRCARLPATLNALFAEALVLFREVDALRDACSEGRAQRCVDALFDMLDVARDDRLSRAEIARGVRAAAPYFAYESVAATQRTEAGDGATIMSDAIPLESVYAGSFRVGLLASFATGSLISSYDYNGDGFLEAAEILQDREHLDLETLTAALRGRLGGNGMRGLIEDLASMLLDAVKSAPFGFR